MKQSQDGFFWMAGLASGLMFAIFVLLWVKTLNQEDRMLTNPNEDYYAWAHGTAEKLRQGKFSEINLEDLIEELESMGRSEQRALESRLTMLLLHLLKWKHQPGLRSGSFAAAMELHRLEVDHLLKDSHSLRPQIPEMIEDAYHSALLKVLAETGFGESAFPATFAATGWSWEQIIDFKFYPRKSSELLP